MSDHLSRCPHCGQGISPETVPPEPPVGTWVKDRYGAPHYRCKVGWAGASSGFYPGGKWEMLWIERGPLVKCGPYGDDL